ncbi:tandem-95 repeat protein, partial [uncultured Erythrobacter sp.]|uniref:tandem-95 repeat protein n=1 Tax=uncultured Erythrobacter sp. TaxID=263913 RepID=UPI00260B6514
MNRELMLAILALDSYNRNYGQNTLTNLGDSVTDQEEAGRKLGDATILNVDLPEGSIEAGFYAITYDWNGERIISYRGTDNPFGQDGLIAVVGSLFNGSATGGDIANGYGVAFGFPDGIQATLSIEYYRAVAGDELASNNITITGHSLGGGLGGLVAELYNRPLYALDPMQFGLAAERAWFMLDPGSPIYDPEFVELVTGGGPVDWVRERAAFFEGVVIPASQGLDLPIPLSGNNLDAARRPTQGVSPTGVELRDLEFAVSTNATTTLRNKVGQLHNDALIVMRLFSEGLDSQDWQQASDILVDSLFSEDVGLASGAAPFDNIGTDRSGTMRNAIAYSALGQAGDDAARPFGNTAINALFDDANELGEALAISDAGSGILDALTGLEIGFDPTLRLKEVLSNILVQYAGALAVHDVEQPELGFLNIEGELIDAREGVLELADDKNTLALDLGSTLWGDVLRTASVADRQLSEDGQLEPTARDDAIFAFFAQQSGFGAGFFNYLAFELGLGNQLDEAEVEAQANAIWEDANGSTLTRFHYQLRDGDGSIDLSERSYGPGPLSGDNTEVDVFVGGASEDNVTGTEGNDLLILGNGDDIAYSLSGRDLIIGGAGDDTIVNNVVAENASDDGDAGEDIFVGQRLVTGGFQNFVQWLTAPKSLDFTVIEEFGDQFDFWAEDVVRYSVEIPGGVPDLGESVSLAPKGVELVNLEKTTFGEYDALRATVKDLNSGKISSDILVNIDVIELSERAETVEITDAFSELPIVLDLGDVQSGIVTSDDYDTISFAQRSKGVFTANGSIRDQGDNPDNDVILGSFQVIGELLATATGAIFDTVFTPAAALHFRGAENVTLSDHDDLYFGGNVNALLGLDSDFFGTPNHLGYGKISGGEGEDVIVHYGSRFIFEDEYIDAEQQALADARDEAIANGETYEGEEPDPNAARAGADLQLVVDGGDDDDRIFVLGGEAAIVVGGEGTDLLYNSSFKGQLFGDGRDGRGAVEGERDIFWWSSGSFIMDAGQNDRLQLFGIPLVGGTNEQLFGRSLEKDTARDFFIPWVTYGLTSSGQLLIESAVDNTDLSPDMTEDEILEVAQVVQNWESGDLGIEFSIFGASEEESLLFTLFRYVGDFARAGIRFAKNLFWRPEDDPLVLDLNGDGFVSKGIGAVYWDNDEDGFGERSGWLSGEDGFLVHDADGDSNITASELFGGPGLSGFTELTDWDTNGDNIVDANDVGFGDLQIWRDANENGITDAGELHALAAFDVTAFSLNAQPTNLITANGTEIRAESFFARSDGTTGGLGELIFETDRGDAQYLGDNRVAGYAPEGTSGLPINAFGYGITTDLAVAASNDLELAQLIESTAAGMTVPDLDVLRDQARGVLGAWARSHSDSLELGAALIGADGSLVDFAVYNEDETGGFWTLNSGADVLASDGSSIARASFEDVLAQAASGGASWQVVQGWSPASRDFTPEDRFETAYLVSTSGAATVIDYAIRQSDAQGEYWTLARGNDVLASDGSVIARASLADIMAQSVAEGSAWRMEDFADPIPDAGFDRAAFNIRDGVVVDYSIWIDDGNGLFAVWASVFEQALESQERFGPNSFGLRGFELDLDNLPDADNSDDSVVRVEIMSLDEIQYAFASGGETFRPELFVAQSASDNTLSYDFDIDDTKDFAATLAESYLAIGRAMAVRIASQGGLAPYFEGVQYDAQTDTFQATSNRELIPLFTALLTDAPAGADETVDYLREWDRILQTVYPDFKRNGNGPRSQAFLMQMIVAGFENSPVDASFLQVAEALSIDEERVLVAETGNADVVGTRGDDLIYIADGAASARGGLGSDVYIVGRDFGEVLIEDVEPILQPGASDYLRFAHLTPDDVFVTKDGDDLIIQEIGTENIITIRNQFEGRWPGIFGGDFSDNTEIVEINFADGTAWDFVDMAYAASHPLDSADVVFGTDAIDVLDGGIGNDILRGGGDSDLYIFDYGYGEDRIIDAENNPFREALDLVVFGDGIDADLLSFERIGSSNDLIIHLLDEDGARTGDILTIEGQFFQQDAFITTLRPNRIEILAFEDGTFLDEKGIRDRVVAEARTDGEDAIWAFDETETLDGGAGNDLLVGLDGADTYIFARGYGDDVIQDRSFEVGINVQETVNTLQLRGINAADIEIVRDPGSPTVSLRIKDTGETVTLKNQFEVTYAFFIAWRDNVDMIQFGDGTVWDQDRLGREVLALERTDGDDTIIGFDWSDTLDGGAGDDRLEGGLFNDTYIFREGYGNDTVFDTGAGNHPLLPAGFDRLDLRGIDLIDVEFSRQATELTLTLRSTGESVTLEGQYDRLGDTVIEELRFNGLAVDWQDLGADDIDLIGTSGDDTLIGTHYAERIDGRGGNDILIGSSDGDTYIFDIGYGQDVINDRIDFGKYRAADTIEFGANVQFADVRFTKEGNDLLISFEGFTDSLRVLDQFGSVLSGVENFVFADGNSLTIEDVEEQLQIAGGTRGDNILNAIDDRPNILDGRQGDDQLNGGSFSDTYLFGVEYGFDTITERLDEDSQPDAVDSVVFGRLVKPEDVVFRVDGLDLVVTIPSSGEQLTIVDGLGSRQIEEFNFFDGTVWGQAEIRAAIVRGTDADDLLIGFDDSDEVMAGGFGNDLLVGKGGNDTYRFNIGDGLDAIEDSAGVDRIELGEGISADMLRFVQVDEGLLIQLEGVEDSLLIRGGLNPSTAIESIVLADGFEFEFEDVRSFVLAGQATANDDIIIGFANRADRLEGGAGNDELLGLTGDDFYVIGENPGLDIISDTGGLDRVRFTVGSSDAVSVRRINPGSGDIAISFEGLDGETVIRGAFANSSAIEEFEFADGVVLSNDDIRARLIEAAASDGNDLIQGFDDANAPAATFAGGRGDDILIGQANGDNFIFRRGDGSDVIIDQGTGTDTLQIEGYATGDLSFERLFEGNNAVMIKFAGSDDQIIVRGQLSSGGSGIETIAFGDGSTLSMADAIAGLSSGATEGNDTLSGTSATEIIDGLGGDDTIRGGGGSDTLIGGDGNDDVRASSGGQVLIGGSGNDYLRGEANSDTYRFSAGFGQDTIEDDGFSSDSNRIVFDETITRDQLLFSQNGRDLIIRVAGTGEQITVRSHYASENDRISRIDFADGSQLSLGEIDALGTVATDDNQSLRIISGTVDGGGGDDDIRASGGGQTLIGGTGNDYLRGEANSDTYVFSAGFGQDIIEDDGLSSDSNRIVFDETITREELEFSQNGRDLIIRVAGTSDQITVRDHYISANDRISRIEFANGEILSGVAIDVLGLTPTDEAQSLRGYTGTIDGGGGNDDIRTRSGSQTIIGGTGNDYLRGEANSDTYVFSAGFGQDRIEDDGFSSDSDRVLFDETIRPDQIVLERVGDALLIRVQGTTDQITVIDHFRSSSDRVSRIEFADGTLWGLTDINDRLIAAGTNSATLHAGVSLTGTDDADTLTGGLGADTLEGGLGDDTLEAGRAGAVDPTEWTLVDNDTLRGGAGNDTLISGEGNDTLDGGEDDDIYEIAANNGRDTIIDSGGNDAILFAADVTPDAVRVRQIGTSDIALVYNEGGDRVLIQGQLSQVSGPIETVEFADGTIWSAADIIALSQTPSDAANNFRGTAGNDVISGDRGNDTLAGLGGDDELLGGHHNDSLDGGSGNDIFEGGGGADALVDASGNEIYRYGLGDGRDTITDSAGLDRVEFGAGITLADLQIERTASNLIIYVGSREDRITIAGAITNSARIIETFAFADGTTASFEDLLAQAPYATTGVGDFDLTENDDDYVGDHRANTIGGLGGNDTLAGRDGNDILRGGDGNDTLLGELGNDTLEGGAGDDQLDGGRGDDNLQAGADNDTYFWSLGAGQDRILDTGGIDTVSIDASISIEDITVVRNGTSDVQLRVNGSSDRLLLQGVLSSTANQIETISFADGRQWTHADLVAFTTTGSPQEDTYNGLSTADALSGAAGDDRIFGNGGDDILRGDAGNDRVDGGSGNDTITGGTGNDLLQGGSNDDTYIYAAGDGRDIVRDASGVDSIQISGFSSADLTARRFEAGNDDLLLDFGNGNSILIIGGLAVDTLVETITFVDSGETLAQADLVSRAISDLASADSDTIIGTDLAEELTGGAGNDILAGGLGDDIYRFNLGDGIDRIVDTGGTSDLIIFSDFSAADITDLFRSPPAGDDLIITFSSGDTAVLVGSLGDGDEGVDIIEFSDGTTITPDEFRADLIAGLNTPNAAQIYGFSGNDTLAGGAGEDALFGLLGDDTYIYRAGDGNDRIEDNGGGNDRIVIEGYASTDVRLSRLFYASTGVALNFIGSPADSLTIINLTSEGEDRIESIEFTDDGVVWDFATIEALIGNNAPIVNPDGFRDVVQGKLLEIGSDSLLGNDFDADGDPLSIQSVGEVVGGTATLGEDGTIEFTSDPEFIGFASVTYLVSDSRQGVTEASVSIRVRPEAIANDDVGISVDEDQTLIIRDRDLLANDVDGDRFEVSQVKDAVNGTVSLSSNGDITFTPFADFNGEASFVYVANTPDGGRDEATVTIDVVAVNDAPIARNDATGLSTDEGVPIVIERAQVLALLDNDSDIDGDFLTIGDVAGDGNVDAELLADGTILLTSLGDFFGSASFTYVIDDGAGGTASATASLVINPVNDVPVTQADSFVIDEDNPLFFSGDLLTENDFDPDGTPVIISAVRSAVGGDVELFENNTILFTPDVNFFGEAGFTYVVDDGEGGVTSQVVSITVNPINDAPVARDERPFGIGGIPALITQQDEVLVIDPATILANDFDIEGDAISIETVSAAVNGDVELRDDGLIYFTPDEGYWGFANFRYVISDEAGLVDDANVSVYFRPTGNVAPVAVDDRFTGVEDQPLIITREELLANDFDPNGDAIEVVSVRSLGASANQIRDFYFNEAGDLVIEPIPDLPGSGTLLYTITDGVFTDEGRIDVNFAPVDDAPTAVDDADFDGALGRPVVIRISDLTANDFDIDQSSWLPSGGFVHRFGSSNLEILDTFTSSEGTASIYGEEFIVIEIDPAFSGDLTLGYTLSDETGLTDTANVATTVRDARDLVIEGTELRDLLIGSAQGETLVGLAGEDDLLGREGDDILRGGDGADILDGGEGFDVADFSDSDVTLRVDINSRIGQGGFAQGDELISIEGLIGGLGADQLFGTDDFNTIAGGAGDDFIDGRAGDDILSGDAGDDTIVGAEGADTINGGEGSDTADYSDSVDPVAIDLAAGTASGGDAEGDTLISIENLTGTLGADSLTGNDVANILIGGRGGDTILAGGGDDLIEGGRDGDIIDGGEGVDTARYWLSQTGIAIDLGASTASGGDAEGDQITNVENIIGSAHDDTITGDALDNVIAGLGGADALDGGEGTDTLDYSDSVGGIAIDLTAGTGSAGDAAGDTVSNFENVFGSRFGDTITGDAGDNLLDGSLGDDTLTGAGGSDRYILSRGSGSDIINEASSPTDTDVLEIVGDFAPEAVSVYADGDDLIVELEQGEGIGSDKVRITDHFYGDGTGIETLVFGDGTVWDRATIDASAGAGRLQAEGDIVRLVDEDVAFTFAASDLLVNDVSADDAVLSVVSVEAISGGAVTLNADDTITFLGEQDFNGDAFFRYRMTDGTGRVSSAVVEVNVRPVNDAPVAVDDDDGYVVNEDGSISIPFAWLLANDSDVDGDNLTINGFEDVEGGNGTASIVAAGFVTFRPDADYNGQAAFRYRLSDGNGGFDFATVSVEVLPVNDAPRPQSDSATVRSGNDILISAASLLANDFDLEGDAFSFAGIGEGVNGTVALEIIDGAQFIRFTPDADFVGSASFTYSVSEDGTGLTGTASVNVTVLPPNDPPVANGETFDGLEDTPLVITQAELLANDTDPNGDTLFVSRLDEFPEQGSVAFDDDGNIVFTPAPDYNGPVSFKYWVSDGEFEVEATASIEVAPINDAPVVVDDEGPFIGDEDKVFVIRAADVFGNDSDPEGDVLEFAEFETDIGSIELDGGNLLLTPPLNFNGTITVRYRARDDKGAISEDFASVTIEISDIADAPETVADSFTTEEDTPLELAAIDLIGNDTDVDSTELTLVAVENAVGGVVSLVDGVVTFTPNPDFFGTASFDYLVTDGDTNPVTGSVTIDVTPVNDAARVTGDSFAGDEDVALNLAPSAFLANDIDPDGDTITITAVTAITEGASAVIEDDGTITLTPPANESGQIRFEYTVSDGTVETTGQVSVFVAAVNDAPVLDTELSDLNSAEDTAFSFALETGNFSDVDSSPLAFSATLEDGSPLPDWIAFDGENLTGTPPQHFNGTLSITVTAGDGEFSASDTFMLTIDPVNDAPMLVQMLSDVSGDEDTAISFALPADAFVDVDGDALTLTAALSDGSALPDWLTFDGVTFEGTPPEDFNGNLELTVTASDGEFTAEDTFTLSIDPVNDAPVLVQALADVTTVEDAAISIAVPTDTFTDVDGDALALTATLGDGSELPAWLSFDGTAFTGTPPQDFNGSLGLTVTASDGELSVSDSFTLNIDPVNDAPVLTLAIEDANTAEDTAFAFAIPAETFADVDGDALTLTATRSDGSELPDWISFDGTEFTGTPPENFFGLVGLTVTASDGELSVSDNFTLQIASVNDAPELLQGIANVFSPEDAAISITLPANTFVDIDGDALTLSATLEDGGALPDWLSFDGVTFTGTPPQDFNGSLALTVTASDGELSASDTFTLTIDPVNDAPTLVQALPDVSFGEDTAISVAVPPETFEDVDGDTLSISATLADGSDLPTWLSFDGATFSGTPPQDFNGSLALTVTASDGELSASDTFSLTIDPVNDAPVLVQALADVSSDEDAPLSIELPADAFTDVDGDALTLSAALSDGTALPAWLDFDGTTFTGTPPQDLNGSIELSVTASDGEFSVSDTFTLTIDPVNDAPTLVQATADVEASVGDALTIDFANGAFADVDGDALTFSASLSDGSPLPSWLTFAGGVLVSDSVPAEAGDFEITVTASDDQASASDSFVLTVIGGNTAPVAEDDGVFVTTANRTLAIDPNTLFENDVDAEGDALTLVSVQDASIGEVSVDGDGNILYIPDAVYVGEATFTYTVTDGEFISTATVSIDIDPSDQFDGFRQGNDNNNFLFGSLFGRNRIFGAGGNDRIFGGFASDELAGGDGNDRIFGLWGNDDLYGGQGDDTLFGGFGFDTAHLLGDRDDYQIFTSGGFFNVTQTVDLNTAVDGDDGVDTLISIEQLEFKDGVTLNIASPIILDLAGDGV